MTRDSDIRAVANELDKLIDQLRDSVTALNAVLIPPPSVTAGDDEKDLERA